MSELKGTLSFCPLLKSNFRQNIKWKYYILGVVLNLKNCDYLAKKEIHPLNGKIADMIF